MQNSSFRKIVLCRKVKDNAYIKSMSGVFINYINYKKIGKSGG